MKIYSVVTTILLIIVTAGLVVGYVKYVDLQTQITDNVNLQQHNDQVLQKEIIDLYKRKPVNKFFVIIGNPNEKPSSFDPNLSSTR